MSISQLVELCRGRAVLALTGAGCSTESGIPDYRGPGRREPAPTPVQFQAFKRDPETRRRYWARSVAGWQRFQGARPNGAHLALAELEQRAQLAGLITQNVDRLHHAAGSRQVIELHGALERVRCLDCAAIEARRALQLRLLALNPGWPELPATALPDGDAELESRDVLEFEVAACLECGGVLKPDVVFFGENVPRTTVDAAYEMIERADALLVVGSSLSVFSGYRFVRRAAELGKPIGIVNLGPTRGDPLATLRVDGSAGEVLGALERALGSA